MHLSILASALVHCSIYLPYDRSRKTVQVLSYQKSITIDDFLPHHYTFSKLRRSIKHLCETNTVHIKIFYIRHAVKPELISLCNTTVPQVCYFNGYIHTVCMCDVCVLYLMRKYCL